MRVLASNPGSASLKFELVEVFPGQSFASDGKKLLAASVEAFGPDAKILVFDGREVAQTEAVPARDIQSATRAALRWLRSSKRAAELSSGIAFAAVRVVHGGLRFAAPVRLDGAVRQQIHALEELAPLHNRSALDVFSVLEEDLPHVPLMAAFDTAFHRTLPERAWRYPIDRATADRFGIRKFGFHGLSHRFMLEQYAKTAGKSPEAVSLVTLHLESGSSAAAIEHGRSIDTSMGLTPLEGLMMGTRSGSIDPAIVSFLMHKMNTGDQEVMRLLNKQSGLLGIAGETFDTRILAQRSDPAARLALEMFSYRVRLAIGAYLAVLPECQAVIFGGGIGEDTPGLRQQACDGMHALGIELDQGVNARTTAGPACISTRGSRIQVHVLPVEEGMQMAHECALQVGPKPTC